MSLPTEKIPFIEIATEAVKKIQQPLLLYGIVESVLLIVLLVFGKDVPVGLLPVVYALIIFPVLIAISHFALEYHNRQLDQKDKKSTQIKSEAAGVPAIKVFARSDSVEFSSYVYGLAGKCQRFVLIGTGLNILQRDPFAKDVLTRAAKGDCHLEIYLADPQSPDVETRLIEEEMGEFKPPIGQPGLFSRLETLMRQWKNLGYPDSIQINAFTHYPTFALLIIDQEYFIYPYGFTTLGNFSPVIRFSKDNQEDQAAIEFLDNQYRNVKAHSCDVRKIFAVRKLDGVSKNDLYPLAVYIIPPENSAFYKFGAQVLGYDIRHGTSALTPWQDQVGSAREFGFHLTVCDALYFLNEADASMAKASIEFLARGFKPFTITDLHLKPHFPDLASLSVVGHDSSGNLEALHSELVHHVNRRAVASNYTLRIARPDRDHDLERAKLMIDRYKAPYILQRFQPHFTLLTQIHQDKQTEITDTFEKLFADQVEEKTLEIEKLAIMKRPTPDGPWIIDKEIKLG